MSIQNSKLEASSRPSTRGKTGRIFDHISALLQAPASKADSGSILSLDVQSLSLFRIIFGIYLAAEFFIETYPWYGDLYGPHGILPLPALFSHATYPALRLSFPLLSLFDTLQITNFVPAIYAVAVFGFAVGFRTRWSNAIVFVLHTYLYWRNTFIRSGADDLAHFLLLWCLFLPMNRCWSFDSALDPQPSDRPYPALPFVAIRLQIASLYVFSALIKLTGTPWRTGDAIVWSLSDTAFGATPAGLFVVSNFSGLLHAMSYMVIVFQLAFPFLIYCPWHNNATRAVALLGAAAMHVSFIFCLNIGAFPFLSLTALILLVPDAWIDRLLLRRRARLSRTAIFFDPQCEFCRRVALVLREFLLPRTAPVLPASADPEALQLLQQHQSWVVRAADGTIFLKWKAMAHLLKQNVATAPLGLLSDLRFMRRPMERLYDLIGANRMTLAPFTRWLLPDRKYQPIGSIALTGCVVLLLAALASNISSIAGLIAGKNAYIGFRLAAVLQVGNNWTLFAPVPTHQTWNFTVSVHKDDGSVADFMTLLPVPLFKTSSAKAESASNRWTKYFTRFAYFTDEDWRAFGRYVCGRAQRSLGATAKVTGVDVKASTRSVEAAPSDNRIASHEEHFACPDTLT